MVIRKGRPVLGPIVACLGVAFVVCAVLWRINPLRASHVQVASAQDRSTYEVHTGGSKISGCPAFPADNVWNTPVDRLPKDKQSETYLDSIGPSHKFHPDFGADMRNGIPFMEIPPGTAPVKLEFEYRDDSDLGMYPVPPDAPVEGGPQGTGDRHILLVDAQRCLLYELFAAVPKNDGSWKAGSGIRMDLTGNALREAGKTSADAAGLPILPGLVRYDEVAAGEIRHALRFTVPQTQAAYVWPARHFASKVKSANVPPLGERFRLRSDFDISRFSKPNQVILTGLKRYGMFLADNGSSMYLSGVPDKRWDDDDLHHLSSLRADDFEAVDESSLQLLPNSGRVDPKALPK